MTSLNPGSITQLAYSRFVCARRLSLSEGPSATIRFGYHGLFRQSDPTINRNRHRCLVRSAGLGSRTIVQLLPLLQKRSRIGRPQ